MLLCEGRQTGNHAFFFFFNDTATTEIYTLSLHDALPIWPSQPSTRDSASVPVNGPLAKHRSEEHTSELQSQSNLVCRLLLEQKKKTHLRKNQRVKNQATPNKVIKSPTL